jgi:Ca2+-binding RTX toxin-like protein
VEALGSDITLNVDSGPIELNAPVTSNGGYIMVFGDSVGQNANIITSGVGMVTVTADNGAITMDSGTMTTSIGGNITYSATADVSLSILTSTNGIVFVTAGFGNPATGSILDNNNSETVNIRGNSVLLLAALSIGTSINALETQVHNTIIVTAFSPLTVQENILSAEDIVLTATDSAGLGDDLVLIDAVSIVSTGGSVTLRVGDNLLITADNVVKATGDVIIHGDYGNADTGIGSTIDLRGTILGTSALIMGNNDDDIISLTNVNAVTPTTIQTFDGDDLVHVGSNATPTSNLGGNVNSISALLSVYGGSGNDRLKVDDSGDDEPNSGTLTATTITGLGMQDGITYGTLEHLNIALGSGGNDFKIDSTHAGTTTITFGEGDDTINVRTTGGVLNIDAEGGDDIIYVGSLAPGIGGTLNGIGGLLTLEGGSGFDILNVDDTGDTIPNTGAMTDDTLTDLGMVDGIAYGTMENLEVSLGSVNDTLSVNCTMKGDDGFHRVTVVNMGAGDDMVNVSLQVETDGFFALNTEAGDDHVDASISTLPLAIFGGEDDDTILGGAGDDVIVGDRGRIDYRDGAGTLITRLGIDLTERNVIAPGADDTSPLDVPLRQTDGLSRSPSLVVTRDPTIGGTDLIEGNGGDDIILGGTASDMIHAGNGVDLIFGDQGEVLSSGGNNQVVTYYDETPPWYNGYTYTATETQNDSAGASDVIYGEAGGDYILGQQGTDLIWGGDDDDDIYGGHNVAGGYDTGDFIDGGTGNDVIAGDNASIRRTGAAVSPRFRALEGTMIYGEDPVVNDGLCLVTDDAQEDPTGAHVRTIVLFDHSTDTATGTFGDDTIAGGADEDMIFGQFGDDTLHGDGQLVETQPYELMSLTDPISGSNIGGDDYIEGNGGEDTIFGGLGQDDIIGGSSSLLSLGTPDLRPDGSDTIFGGNGDMTARNDPGDESSDGHARDADVIAGDNANILRLVGVNGEVGVGETGIATFDGFLAFNYDIYSSILRIIPRSVELLDYTPGGLDWNPAAESDIGAADEIHGESGDDVIYGMLGGDVLFGEGQDDDITGGTGHDFISAGTGTDGVIGDDGRIYTSRNSDVPVGETGYSELLYGILPVQVDRGSDIKVIITPGNIQYAQINELGELKKTVNLTPFGLHDGDFSEPRDADFDPDLTEADDIIFGGWGDDFLHGGVGDDAISGAEVLPEYYAQAFDSDNPGTFNPGNILGYSQGTVQTGDNGKILLGRAEEFAAYNEYDPRSRILVAKNENGIWEFTTDGSRQEFVLNYNTQGEGEFIRSFIDAEGNTVEIWSDGDDTIFGDLGNDWLVGGTGSDHLWGGYGNDLLNADDDLDTGDVPDGPEASYEDLAYGGAGRDVLIANTGGDRLIDWAGEFNSYIVPFAPFGLFTISRSLQPQMKEFLYDLSEADGADPTRANDTGKSEERNGEPEGEIGLVQQQDDDWHDQTGAPKDIQPGNIPGGKRDVIGSAAFNTGIPDGYAADSGIWIVDSGQFEVSPEVLGGDAVSVMHIQDPLPSYFEIQATINAGKPTAGYKSNAFLIFDYQSPIDYKYAGVNISNNKLEMGYCDATGWHEFEQTNAKLKPDTAYHLLLVLNGTTATLVVNGSEVFTHVFEARVEDSYAFGLNAGMVGLGAYNSIARIDDVKVQVLPPEITFQATDEFDPEVADLFAADSIGSWIVTDGRYVGMPEIGMDFAASTMDMLVASASFLEIETVLQTDAIAGVFFDCYSPTDFKFAAISVQDNQVLIGHHTKRGWFIDATEEQVLDAGMDYRLRVSLKGTTISVAIAEAGDTIGDLALLGYSFNAVVVDGAFGLLSKDGSGSFESASVKTNDPVFLETDGSDYLMAASAPEAQVEDDSRMRLSEFITAPTDFGSISKKIANKCSVHC